MKKLQAVAQKGQATCLRRARSVWNFHRGSSVPSSCLNESATSSQYCMITQTHQTQTDQLHFTDGVLCNGTAQASTLESQHILSHHRKEPGKLKGFRKVLVVMILLEIRLVNSLWGSAHEAASVVGAARP